MRMLVAITLFGFSSFSAHAEGWTCSAPSMLSGSYDGGSMAYIHLTGFSTGGTYAVNKKGNRAMGTTANGTKFSCTVKK